MTADLIDQEVRYSRSLKMVIEVSIFLFTGNHQREKVRRATRPSAQLCLGSVRRLRRASWRSAGLAVGISSPCYCPFGFRCSKVHPRLVLASSPGPVSSEWPSPQLTFGHFLSTHKNTLSINCLRTLPMATLELSSRGPGYKSALSGCGARSGLGVEAGRGGGIVTRWGHESAGLPGRKDQ